MNDAVRRWEDARVSVSAVPGSPGRGRDVVASGFAREVRLLIKKGRAAEVVGADDRVIPVEERADTVQRIDVSHVWCPLERRSRGSNEDVSLPAALQHKRSMCEDKRCRRALSRGPRRPGPTVWPSKERLQ